MNISSRKGYIDSIFGQLHFHVTGEGKPLILCHQSPSSLEMFSKAFEPLARSGIQVIAVDTPGYGQSDAPTTQPSIHDYSLCVLDLIEFLKLKKYLCLAIIQELVSLLNFQSLLQIESIN